MIIVKRIITLIISIAIFLSLIIVSDASESGKIKFVVFDNCIEVYAENLDGIDFSLDMHIQYNKDAIVIKEDKSDEYLGCDANKIIKYVNDSSLEYRDVYGFYYTQIANISNSGEIFFGMYIRQSLLEGFSPVEYDINMNSLNIATFYFSYNDGFDKTDIGLNADCYQYECYYVNSEADTDIYAKGIYKDLKWELCENNGLLKLEKTENIPSYNCSWFAFSDKITNIEFYPGITDIGERYFENCGINEVFIPKTVKTISEYAFSDCSQLNKVVFEEGSELERICDSAFMNCPITEISFPEKLKYIGGYAFSDCRVKDIIIPASVEYLSYYFCTNYKYETENIIVDKNNSVYCSVDGVLYNKDMTEVIRYPAGKKESEFTIPYGVNTISANAFCSAAFSKVYLPDTVKSIGWRAFSESAITDIEIPDSVCEIDASAFASCKNLKKVKLSENVNVIFPGVFMECVSLEEVKLSESTTNIRAVAFANCTSLERITIPKSIKGISPIAFSGCSSLSDIYFFGNEEQWKEIYKSGPDEGMLAYPRMSEDVKIHYHDKHNYDSKVLIAAECNKQGEIQHICDCGASYIEQTAALKHNWSKWVIKIPANYENEGVEIRSCSLCKISESRKIDKLTNKSELIFDDDTVAAGDDILIVSGKKLLKDIIKNQEADIIITDKNGNIVDTDSAVASGMMIVLKDTKGNVTDTVVIVVFGDNDGDGKVTASDARTALRASVKLDKLNEWQMNASNVDDIAEGDITAADARYILRVSVGLENTEALIDLYK